MFLIAPEEVVAPVIESTPTLCASMILGINLLSATLNHCAVKESDSSVILTSVILLSLIVTSPFIKPITPKLAADSSYVPSFKAVFSLFSEPLACAIASSKAAFTALDVSVAPVTPSISLDCFSMICFCSSSLAAPPMDSVSPDTSSSTFVISEAENVAVTLTSELCPLPLPV